MVNRKACYREAVRLTRGSVYIEGGRAWRVLSRQQHQYRSGAKTTFLVRTPAWANLHVEYLTPPRPSSRPAMR